MGMKISVGTIIFVALISGAIAARAADLGIREYSVHRGSHPHDVAPAVDGGVWYTARRLLVCLFPSGSTW